MTRETLAEMGLTEEQAEKVMAGLDGDFVPKSRFNEVNAELNAAKATVKERDKQLEGLKKAAGDADALQKQIEGLQAANAEQKKAHDAEMKQIRIDSAVERALAGAKAKNNIAAKALLAEFLKTADLADDGTVKGLDAEVKKLAEGEETSFLFEPARTPGQKFTGARPGEKGDIPPAAMTLEQFRALPPAERYKFSSEHPEEYKALYGQGGK